MENKSYKRIPVLLPNERLLEAYKAWMTELAKQLSPEKAEINWIEEEWNANWEKFWKEKPSN